MWCRYGAKVVNVQAKLDPKLAEEKAKYIETVRQESTEAAIEQVKKKIKDAQEAAAEAARVEAGMQLMSFYHLEWENVQVLNGTYLQQC